MTTHQMPKMVQAALRQASQRSSEIARTLQQQQRRSPESNLPQQPNQRQSGIFPHPNFLQALGRDVE